MTPHLLGLALWLAPSAAAADDPLAGLAVTEGLLGVHELALVAVPSGHNQGRVQIDVKRQGAGLKVTWFERIELGEHWKRAKGLVELDRHLAVRRRATMITTAQGTDVLSAFQRRGAWELSSTHGRDDTTVRVPPAGIDRGGLAVQLVLALALAGRAPGTYGLDALVPAQGDVPAHWSAVGVRVQAPAPAVELPGAPTVTRVTFVHDGVSDHVYVDGDGALVGLRTEGVDLLGLACVEEGCTADVAFLGDLDDAAVREAVVTMFAVQLGGRPLADLDAVMDWDALFAAIPVDAPGRPADAAQARDRMHAAIGAGPVDPAAVRAVVEDVRRRLTVTVDGDGAEVTVDQEGGTLALGLERRGELWKIVRLTAGR